MNNKHIFNVILSNLHKRVESLICAKEAKEIGDVCTQASSCSVCSRVDILLCYQIEPKYLYPE